MIVKLSSSLLVVFWGGFLLGPVDAQQLQFNCTNSTGDTILTLDFTFISNDTFNAFVLFQDNNQVAPRSSNGASSPRSTGPCC
jgi:hypothetical protein